MPLFPKINEPSRGNPDLTCAEAITETIRAGSKRNAAAHYAGIWPETLSRWLQRGATEMSRMLTEGDEEPQETEEPYVKLSLDILHAEAMAEVRSVAQWQQHFPRDWRAIERFMQNRYDDWKPAKREVELSGPGGGPVPIGVQVIGPDEAEAILARAEARQAIEAHEAAALPEAASQ